MVCYTLRSSSPPALSSLLPFSSPGTTASSSRQGSQSSVTHSVPVLRPARQHPLPRGSADGVPLGQEEQRSGAAYLTKKTVSLQNDSSQLGPGSTSAHRGSRWCGRVTLSVKRNSRPAAVTRASSRMTQEDVKSGVNLTAGGTFVSSRWFSL